MSLENATYDSSTTASVAGRAGLFKGEQVTLRLGQIVVIGRSRSCAMSLAKAPECLRIGKEAMERHKSYRKISRKHIRICLVNPDILEIDDLSTNGTVVDGHRIDRRVITGFANRVDPVLVEFGEGEIVAIQRLPRDKESSEAHTEIRDVQPLRSSPPSDVNHTPVP